MAPGPGGEFAAHEVPRYLALVARIAPVKWSRRIVTSRKGGPNQLRGVWWLRQSRHREDDGRGEARVSRARGAGWRMPGRHQAQ